MFTLAKFIKKGFISAVGKMADYQIILNAAGWYEKGVLSEKDLADIQTAIDDKNARVAAEEAERQAAEEAARQAAEEAANAGVDIDGEYSGLLGD